MSATKRDFVLPDLGEGLEDATIVEWHVAVDDEIALNQPLCTVETAKATVEIPSPFAGRVTARIGEPGDTVLVGDVLVQVQSAGEPREAGAVDAPVTPNGGDEHRTTETGEHDAPAILVGYGPRAPRASRRRRGGSGVDPGVPATASDGITSSPLAKPPVRHLARRLGVDLASIAPGSGPGGVITRADVTDAAGSATASGAEPRQVAFTPAPPDVAEPTGGEIPLQGVRARIADRMTEAHTIPDAACAVEVDCSELLAVRDRLRAQSATRPDAGAVTPFALMLRLLVTSLRDHPILNSVIDVDAGVIRVHDAIHLGIGASTDRGLMVPVVRNAERRSTIELAAEVRRLAEGARHGTLAPAELVGSTFTVSNFGSFGLDDGYPMINHPEVAILGIGAIRARPVVVDGEVVARPTARVTCSFDHRVCDGADVGHFLARLRELVETPTLLLLDA